MQIHIHIHIYNHINHRRKLRSQTSDTMDRWKAEVVRVKEEKRREEERRSKERKSQKKEDPGARKGRKVAKYCKVGLLKRRVQSQLARWEMKNCTPLWREAHLQVKKLKPPHLRTTFGSWDVEKVHAVVARSTFRSQNVQKTPCSDHFWKLRCRKSARRCGAKHVSKSKCTKHTMFGPLLEVEMSKKCTPLWREPILKSKCTKHTILGPLLEVEMSKKCTSLWREAHFEVKMYKTHQVRTTFGGSDVVSRGRRTGLCTLSKVSKTWGFCSTFNYNHHYTTLHSNTLHYTTFHYTTLHTLHYTTLRYTTPQLHYTTFHYTTLHSTTLHYTQLHYTTRHDTTLHYTEWHCTTDRRVDR